MMILLFSWVLFIDAFVLLGSVFLILFVSGGYNAFQRLTLMTLNLLYQKLVPSYSSIRMQVAGAVKVGGL